MIDVIKQQFRDEMPINEKLNLSREFLQILILKIMSDKGMFDRYAFVGGTCLRVLYDLRRFSEDLDFSLTDKGGMDIGEVRDECVKALELYGLPCEAKPRSVGAVSGMMIKFPGLLKELGISPLSGQKLSIKWEADTNPPGGWQRTHTIVNKHFMFNVAHYDLPSLFAGKLHACFYRTYTKGRDWYDFLWYLSKRIKPNLPMLNNAIIQTEKKDAHIDENNFKDYLLEHIEAVDFKKAKKDVERFLEDKGALSMFDKEMIKDTITSML
jgi:predicted nucleotidyltransferase component of viral defense system